jgi:hypothetical protein
MWRSLFARHISSEPLACACCRTEEPEVVERLVVRAGEYLDQAAALEAAEMPVVGNRSTPRSSKPAAYEKRLSREAL